MSYGNLQPPLILAHSTNLGLASYGLEPTTLALTMPLVAEGTKQTQLCPTMSNHTVALHRC